MEKVLKYLKENERSLSWLARKCNVSPTNKHKVMIKEATGIRI